MDYQKIDISTSVEKQRLILKLSFFEKLIDRTEKLVPFSVLFVFLFPILLIFDQIKHSKTEYLIITIPLFILGLILSALLIYSVLNIRTLSRIKGESSKYNRELVNEIAITSNWKVEQDNEEITILYIPYKWFSTNWGRYIYIIYDGQDILVNCTSLGRNGIGSPFHWDENRKYIKIIHKFFNEKLVDIA